MSCGGKICSYNAAIKRSRGCAPALGFECRQEDLATMQRQSAPFGILCHDHQCQSSSVTETLRFVRIAHQHAVAQLVELATQDEELRSFISDWVCKHILQRVSSRRELRLSEHLQRRRSDYGGARDPVEELLEVHKRMKEHEEEGIPDEADVLQMLMKPGDKSGDSSQASVSTSEGSVDSSTPCTPEARVPAADKKKQMNRRLQGGNQRRNESPESAGSSCTTVVVRHLPHSSSGQAVAGELDKHGLAGKYNFVYLPRNFRKHCALGYAFVNFCSSEDASDFLQTWEKKNSGVGGVPKKSARKAKSSQKTALAERQGFEQNVLVFWNNHRYYIKDVKNLPIVFNGQYPQGAPLTEEVFSNLNLGKPLDGECCM